MQPVRILIVEDHPSVRRGLAEVIAAEPDLEVCGQAEDATEAMRQIENTHPHLMIIDLSLKSGHGIDLIEQIKISHEQIKMIVSSMHDESLFAERALRAGAMGYLNKQEPVEKVIEAIRQVMRGEVYLSQRMTHRLLQSVVSGPVAAENPIAALSNRELQVFEMVGRGMSTKQIANKLQLSHKTIETHREKIKTKLGLNNSNELNHRAVQWVLENR